MLFFKYFVHSHRGCPGLLCRPSFGGTAVRLLLERYRLVFRIVVVTALWAFPPGLPVTV